MRLDIQELLFQPPVGPDWLVPGMISRGSMVALVGDAGVGKSYLCYSLALALACGRPFLGRQLIEGRTLYIDEENGQQDLHAYLRWAWHALDTPDPAILADRVRIEHFSVTSRGMNDRYHFLRAAAVEHRPQLIVIDTATPVCNIADENDNAEASGAVRALRGVRAAAGDQATLLVLKHARVDQEGHLSMRGAKTWRGELDGIIFHKKARGGRWVDGVRPTVLQPDKHRAFGLRESIRIVPEVMRGENGSIVGLKLTPIGDVQQHHDNEDE